MLLSGVMGLLGMLRKVGRCLKIRRQVIDGGAVERVGELGYGSGC